MPVAFVLSGGASLGAAQVGMLKALYERRIRPDLLVGTSAGAINAAFAASRPASVDTADELRSIWCGIGRGDVFPASPIAACLAFTGVRDHAVSPAALRRTIRRHLELDRLEDAAVPLHVVTSDAHTGEEVLLSTGPAADAVVASAAIPGVFPPVRWGRRSLVDGGVVNNTPISHAVELGADRIYVLSTFAGGSLGNVRRGALGAGTAALARVIGRRLEEDLVRYTDAAELIVMPPPVAQILPTDFGHAAELIDDALRVGRLRLRRPPAAAPQSRAA
jgi:NTE family protein